jgi:hypothetical protein
LPTSGGCSRFWRTKAQPELAMKVTHSLAQLQKEHVVLELECIDRMYLNAYVPKLTSEGGIAAFCRGYLGHRFASTKQAVAMTQAFVKSIEAFLQREGLELIRFQKGQRKDAVLQQKLRRFKKQEGVIFVGVAQEKVRVPRTTRKACPGGGTSPGSFIPPPWSTSITSMPRQGLWPLLPQVLLLFPLLGQALPQRP